MRKPVCFALFCAMTCAVHAQPAGGTSLANRPDAKEINFLDNAFAGTSNPAGLSFNTIHTLTRATVNTQFLRGGFHAIDESRRDNALSVDIFGLKRIGRLSLSGNIAYLNAKGYDHRWNNTALLSDRNPFVLADSVASDVNREQFGMHATAALRLSEKLVAALKFRFTTVALSDQTDPRPKTNAMHFEVVPGVIRQLNGHNRIGVAGHIDVYRSDISHTVMNNLVNNVYFLMRGMGDYVQFTSGGNANYTRNYRGTRLAGSLQWHYIKGDAFGNMLEVHMAENREMAEDGGASYTYKGGDYDATQLDFYDRLTFRTGTSLWHQFILRAALAADNGFWYDQVKRVDTEHANRTYYEVLNKSKVHRSVYTQTGLEYRLDERKGTDCSAWTAIFKSGVSTQETTHYEAESYKQKYSMLHAEADFTKRWRCSNSRIAATLGVCYAARLGDPTYNSVRDKLVDSYSKPMFEYATASQTGFKARLSMDIPVSMYGTPTWVTLYAQALNTFYTGNNRYSVWYKNTSRSVIDAGVSLTL